MGADSCGGADGSCLHGSCGGSCSGGSGGVLATSKSVVCDSMDLVLATAVACSSSRRRSRRLQKMHLCLRLRWLVELTVRKVSANEWQFCYSGNNLLPF